MKGKIKLVRMGNPVEGMKVITPSTEIGYIVKVNYPYIVINGTSQSTETHPHNELRQIVVEYQESVDAGSSVGNTLHTKTLPIPSDNWEYALKYIGEEVEFYEEEPGVAKLYPEKMPTPVHISEPTYTENEVLDLIYDWLEELLDNKSGYNGDFVKYWELKRKRS